MAQRDQASPGERSLPFVDGAYMLEQTAALCRVPSPSGFTRSAVDFVAVEFERLGIPTRRTAKGALVASQQGGDPQRDCRTLSAHADTLGVMVKEIKDDGRLKRDETSLEIRLDEPVRVAADARALRIEVGDFVSLDPRTTITACGFIKSRHLDDKACVATLLGVARALMESGDPPPRSRRYSSRISRRLVMVRRRDFLSSHAVVGRHHAMRDRVFHSSHHRPEGDHRDRKIGYLRTRERSS